MRMGTAELLVVASPLLRPYDSVSCIFKLQMEAGMRYVCCGKVHEAANCEGRVVPLGEEKIKQTIGVLRIDFKKTQM